MENKRKRADRRKNHIIYKTTCLITERFYIGMHSTDNLDDGYKGSGKRLRRSINKHGEDNHVTEILETLPNRKALAAREKEIINREFLEDPQCMNINTGGEGGFVSTEGHYENMLNLAHIAFRDKLKNDPEFSKKFKEACSERNIKRSKAGNLKSFLEAYDWKGKKHSSETIEKMKASKVGHGKGSSNSQFGTRYVTDGIESKRIKKTDDIPEGWRLGRTGN